MFNSVESGFLWMVSFTNLEKKPDLTKRGYRLDKMKLLLKIFNNPQLKYKTVHVAGSKGKGSTCAFISSVLTEAGYKTGIYTSPHLLDYRERITCNHNFFSDESYISVLNRMKEVIEGLDYNELPGGEPTTFELMTLMAFLVFEKENCDWVVVETGIGGRIDSTNTVNPELSVITPIELEHTELLGDTLEKIAFEKAGIIKPEKPVITSNKLDNVLNVIEKQAEEMNSSMHVLNRDFETEVRNGGTFVSYNNRSFKIGLDGNIQGENAVLALEAIKIIMPDLDIAVIISGLEKTHIPGRFQIVKGKPDIVLDGAHTRNSVTNAASTFNKIYNRGIVIFGAVEGKDITSMAKVIANSFKTVILSTPGSFKKSNLEAIHTVFSELGKDVLVEKSPENALSLAKTFNEPILVTGSFYMAGEIAKLILA